MTKTKTARLTAPDRAQRSSMGTNNDARPGGSDSSDGLGPWVECPNMTRWGAGMVEALVAVTKDETARVIAHEDAAPMVADAIVSAVRKPLTLAQCRALVAQHFEHGEMNGDDVTLIRAVERAHGIGA